MPEGLLFAIALVAYASMLIIMQMKGGYVAGRYAMPLMPLLAMYAATGMEGFARLARRLPTAWWERSMGLAMRDCRRVIAVASAIAALALALSLPGLARRLHANRAGYHLAAGWIREHSDKDDLIFDVTDSCAFLADRPTCSGAFALAGAPVRYVIVDPEMAYRSDAADFAVAQRASTTGRLVARFPNAAQDPAQDLWIYELPRHAARPGADR
jgi:hypothetical protein